MGVSPGAAQVSFLKENAKLAALGSSANCLLCDLGQAFHSLYLSFIICQMNVGLSEMSQNISGSALCDLMILPKSRETQLQILRYKDHTCCPCHLTSTPPVFLQSASTSSSCPFRLPFRVRPAMVQIPHYHSHLCGEIRIMIP